MLRASTALLLAGLTLLSRREVLVKRRSPVENLATALDGGRPGSKATPAPQGWYRATEHLGGLFLGQKLGAPLIHSHLLRDRVLTAMIAEDSVRTSEMEVPRRDSRPPGPAQKGLSPVHRQSTARAVRAKDARERLGRGQGIVLPASSPTVLVCANPGNGTTLPGFAQTGWV